MLTTVRSVRVFSALVAVTAALVLTACSPAMNEPVIAPVTMSANDLQGQTVDLVVGQVLNIDTGSLPVDSYTAVIEDESVATFTQGREDDTATFNPGINAVGVGSTGVVMTNEEGGIQPLEFTVVVAERTP